MIGKGYICRGILSQLKTKDKAIDPGQNLEYILILHHYFESTFPELKNTMASTKPLVLVIGGTGVQGISVVKRTFLCSPSIFPKTH